MNTSKNDPGVASTHAVIRRVDGTEESRNERFVKKHLPAWVASGFVHLVIALALFLLFGAAVVNTQASTAVLNATAEKEADERDTNLIEEDPGLDANIPAAVPDLDRLAEKTVDDIVHANEPIGIAEARKETSDTQRSPGMAAAGLIPGEPGEKGDMISGDSGLQGMMVSGALLGRTGSTKARLILEGGGTEESERAVARGLAWLSRQQKPNGSWVFDGNSSGDTIAATGMALLPFLAAGETHKTGKKYQQTVERGLKYLLSQQRSDGGFNGGGITMYSHGIATIALNEAYGMTKDRNMLKNPAQQATNFIVAKQAEDGSWGYAPGSPGDTSIVGWQVQALKAAILGGLVVPDKTITSAIKFLDKVSSGSRKAVYGYLQPNGAPATALTSVGLLCRYYISKWGPGNAGLAEGVDGLMKRGPAKAPAKPDMYYYYYATQVVHFADGPEWKDWNEGVQKNGKREGGMRDWLIALQDKKEGPNYGSWESDGAIIGGSCGRIGTTAMSLLTLEVYYRHLPLYKRDNAGGMKALEAVK